MVSSIAADGSPGIAIGDACEIVFDTLGDMHRAQNLRADPRESARRSWKVRVFF